MRLQNSIGLFLAIPVLVLLQVVIFSNINFLGYANPYIYIFLMLILPLDTNRFAQLFIAFILGLLVDIFEFTGGINVFATVFLAYIRPYIISLINFGQNTDNEPFKLFRLNWVQWILYLLILIFIHHFILLFLEQFSFQRIDKLLIQTLVCTVLTFIMSGIIITLFPPKRSNEF